jgi:phosphoenolpyruvate carboxylase
MIEKLDNTATWAEEARDALHKDHKGPTVATPPKDTLYLFEADLKSDLMVIYSSLCDTGNEATAEGFLSDVIRNVSAFGLTLVPLDIRQESDRHEEALDCITRHLGIGSYTEWDEETKINWLVQQLGSKRPLIRAGVWDENPEIFTPSAADTLGIFEMIAEQHEGSLGAYVISQATTASDVLAVYVLQKDAGVKKPLRVAPLFETLDDLKGATGTMESLFSLPTYMGIIQGSQEIMIGYSDSAKDAGRLAASWAQYETQEKLAELAKKHAVDVTFFHGKGGTVGRGGNPATFKAILAHAPDTINGRFRVTEQGEMINQNFGHGDRAERTMDIYTAAVLAEKLTERPKPNDEWRSMMDKLSDISCDAYRRIVREDERFVPYFRSATPELELSKLNIGSRPAKRKAGGGVESLRAIPWNFAWTQTRLNLPTWLGVGEAVGEVLASDEGDKLRDMYRDFESFRTTVDLVEMVLAKSEPSIARHYDNMLVEDEKAQELGAEVRSMHVATENAVLDLTNHTSLSEGKTMLTRALLVRNPYVDCLNVLQAETLKRLRETEEGKEDTVLNDALLTTITGIANGMGNTG